MSITSELREWWLHKFPVMDEKLHNDFTAIADSIDEWNKADVRCEYTRGYTAGFDAASAEVESADELRERIEREYVKMPVDADGKVIHVEDEVELLDGSKRFKVEWLEWDGEGWAVHETEWYGAWHDPSSLRHVQPDSWERIIEDAANYAIENIGKWRCKDVIALNELIERCRRLAGEAE